MIDVAHPFIKIGSPPPRILSLKQAFVPVSLKRVRVSRWGAEIDCRYMQGHGHRTQDEEGQGKNPRDRGVICKFCFVVAF